MHIGEKAATFIICRFSFRRSETAISIFLIDDALKPCVIHCGFGAEDHHMGGVQHFAFVERVVSGSGFCYARFAFFRTGDNKVPRLGIGAGGAVL